VNNVVLDASALLALLNSEPGSTEVERYIPGATVSAVNLSEVIAKLSEYDMPEKEIHEALDGLGLLIIPFDENMAYQAGLLRKTTKEKGLSLGDRACLSLGLHLKQPVLTSDKVWMSLKISLEIRTIR